MTHAKVEKKNRYTGRIRRGTAITPVQHDDHGHAYVLVKWEAPRSMGPIKQILGRQGFFETKVL